MARKRRHLWALNTGLFVACLAVAGARARQPTATPDKVYVRDKKDGSTRTVDGKLTLRPAGLQVLGTDGKALATLSYADVVKVIPGDLAGVDRAAVLAQVALEDKKTKKDYEAARLGYADLLKKATTAPEPSKRYLEFKVAMLSTKIADETGDDEGWVTLADAAAKEWSAFVSEYKSGWELWPAARAAARLDAELNKFDEVARVWSRLSKNGELPAELRQEAAIQEVDAQFRAGVYSNAAVAAKALADAAPPGAVKTRLAVYELAARAGADGLTAETAKAAAEKIEAAVKESADPAVRATAFGVTGELYLAAKVPADAPPEVQAKVRREAMWAFLWVETVYNQDKDEAFKAMCRLVEALKALKDDDRAKAYREKIRRARANF